MGKVASQAVDTDAVAPRERFALWREALAATHEAALPEGCDPARFSASARSHHLSTEMVVLESRATPQCLTRTPRAVRADQLDHYLIRLQKSGQWIGDCGERTVTAYPGTVMVLDMARPSDARTGEIENVNLVLPRDTLDSLVPPFDMHGLVLQGGMAALLRSHLTELAAHLPSLEAADARRLADATLSLVAAC